jgi:hypothetical protein
MARKLSPGRDSGKKKHPDEGGSTGRIGNVARHPRRP